MLNSRTKWTVKSRDLTAGDAVICFEQNLPHGKWPLGRIEEVYQGPDGHVLQRCVLGRICILDLQQNFVFLNWTLDFEQEKKNSGSVTGEL